MSHSDDYVLEEVEEIDVTSQIKLLAAQMKENVKKLQLLEEENRVVRKENSALKEQVESVVTRISQ